MSNNSKITLIFPISGAIKHSGYKYKPFLKIGEETFIEAAVKPFLNHSKEVETIVFIALQKHEKEYADENTNGDEMNMK